MDRRAYLAAAGLFLAGCSNAPETETDPTSTSASSSDTSATATPSSTETESPTPTNTETQTPTEEPTPTATPAPSEVELELRSAVEDLDAAFEKYSAPNMTLMETNATTGKFSMSGVRADLSNAEAHLHNARQNVGDDTSEELRTRLKRLAGVHWFMYWGAPVQTQLKDAIPDLRSLENAIYANDQWDEGQAIDELREHTDAIDKNLEKLKRDSDPDDANAPCELTKEQYIAKLDQFEGERQDIDDLVDLFRDFGSVISDVESALEDYNKENYTDASAAFYDASTVFSDYEESLSTEDYRPAFSSIINRMNCIADAMATGCGHLDTAATAGSNGNSSKRKSARENARDSFEECDAVFNRVTPVANFYDVDNQESLAGIFGQTASVLFGW